MRYLFLLILVGCSTSAEFEADIDTKCQEKLDKKDKALMHCALDLDNCNDRYKAPEKLKQRTYSW